MTDDIVRVIDLVPGVVKPLATVDVADLDSDTFRSLHVGRHAPLLIKGAARHWPALRLWNEPGHLESLAEDREVKMSDTFNPHPADAYYRYTARKTRLADGLRQMRDAAPDSMRSIPSIALPPAWAKDLGDYPFLDAGLDKEPRQFPRNRLFVYRNASTDWHYHSFDETITTQIAGGKRISMFRLTQQNWWPYSQLIESNLHHTPCGAKFFPAELPLVKYEGIIEAGDSVYIPPFWWHGIDPADTSMGFTLAHCFRTPINRLADMSDPVVRRILSRVAANRKKELPYILFMIARSTLSRRLAGEAW
jgi:tRNA wybutosine-synthesizing protein 5